MLPRIGVLPHIGIAGINTVAEATERQHMVVTDIREAFETPYETDAHFTCYTLPDPTEVSWPRINKQALGDLIREGHTPRTKVIALDYDLPGHARWDSPDQARGFKDFVQTRTPFQPSCLYTTRSGGRILFVLDQWIGVEESESVAGFLIAELGKAGIAIDSACYEWNRAYRLPFVVRDGASTLGNPSTFYWPVWDKTIPLDRLGRVRPVRGMTSEKMVRVEIDDDRPTPEEAESLLYVPGAGRNMKKTQWLKLAQKRLRGRECYPSLFEHEPMAMPGRRDSLMHQYVGQATGMLIDVEGTTPAHIYALFLPAVEQFEPDQDTPDWTAKLWSSICRIYSREEGKRLAAEQELAESKKQAQTVLSDIIDGMREWCNAPELQGTEEEQTEYALGHMIVSIARTGNLFMMGPKGYYDSLCLTPEQVAARVRTSNLKHLIATEQPNASGGVSTVATSEIRRRHETVVNRVVGRPNISGGYIDRIDTNSATLTMPLYRVNPELRPDFNSDVDEWLRLMFGDFYEKVENWLAWAVDFSMPISALSIYGPPSIGKGLLVRGLAEVLEDPRLADESDLVGSWQYGLISSPFVVVNEGWPLKMQEEPSAVFRRLTAGDPQDAQAKFQAPMEIHNPARLILTANNEDLVKQLVRRKEMTAEDREAVLIKLLHVECDDKAAIWLKRKGGIAFTGRPGKAWVGGAAGQRSSYIVAQHLLWLSANRKQKFFNQRLCVEGNGIETLQTTIISNAGCTPDVMEAIFSIMAVKHNNSGVVVGGDNRIYAVPNGITKWMRENARPGQRDVNNSVVGSVLRTLAIKHPPTGPGFEVPGLPSLGKRRWYTLDAQLLLDYGQEQGYDCTQLYSCLDAQAKHIQ